MASQTLIENLNKYKNGKFYLTGHSKGGNLAVFAGINLTVYRKRIKQIYNFDGPGFNKEFLAAYKNKINLVREISIGVFIENSIVGELLFGQKELYAEGTYYVKARETMCFLWQHSPFMWEIEERDFIYSQQSYLSKIIKTKLNIIINITPASILKEAVEIFFKAVKRFKSNQIQEIVHVANIQYPYKNL